MTGVDVGKADAPDAPLVVRLITWLPVGGIERRLVGVLPRLRAKGWRVAVICLRERGALADDLEREGVPVETVPLKSRLDPGSIQRLARRLKELKPAIVHSHMYRSNVPGTIAARLAGVRTCFAQVHNVGTWESWRQRWLDASLCRWRAGVVCVSGAVRDDVVRALGIPQQKAPVLYNGIDTGRFAPDEAVRARTRAELRLDDDETMALVPARLHPQKTPLAVLEAFARARTHLHGHALRLMFAGDGPLEGDLRDAVGRAGLGGIVQLLGRRDDMPRLFNAADVVVLSSTKEGFSNAIVEALASGRPVIAADVGGNREAIDRPEVGWIHGAGDTAALEAQIVEAMGDREALAARAPACRARGLCFSIETMIDATDALYREALARTGQGKQRP